MRQETDKTPLTDGRRKPWRRVLRWLLGIVIATVALTGLILGGVVWILTPQKLTPLVERYAGEYLDADVTVKRVELTVWSTFPHIRIDVDSLTVVSHTLSALDAGQRASLPPYADTLLHVDALTGGINLARLAIGSIDLHHVEITRPAVNLVQATADVANYTIVPSSDDTDDGPAGGMPDITIDRFAIIGEAPVRYLSVPDSIDVTLSLISTGITGSTGTIPYEVKFSGRSWLASGSKPLLSDFRIGIDGLVHWSPRAPQDVRLSDFNVDLDSIHTHIDIELSMADPMTVRSASLSVAPTPVAALLRYLPEDMRAEFNGLDTDLAIGIGVTLKAPYAVGKDLLPSASVSVTIPDGSASWLGYRLERAGMEMTADINGAVPDSSVIDVTRLELKGSGVTVGLRGRITNPLSDPMADGRFDGSINFSALPRAITSRLPMTLSGLLSGNTDFRLRNSDLSRNSFHRAYLDGDINLRRFGMAVPDDSMAVYVGNAHLSFGTNSKLSAGAVRVDSLLTASLNVDTASVTLPELELIIAGASVGMGSRNTASSADTTVINPIGGNISVSRLDYRSLTDSARIRLRDIRCGALLRRFQGEGRVPQLGLKATAGRISYGDGLTRMSVSDGVFAVTAHLNPRPKLPARLQTRYDSIAAANPGAGTDSIMALMFAGRHRASHNKETEQLDLSVGNSIGQLLRRWDVRGELTARNGRMVTPYFPLRNRIRDLDLRFTTDSVCLNSFRLTSGGSDMTLSGNISNIRRALTSRTGSPLKVRFAVNSDTLNVNQITRAIFMGAAFSEHADSLRASITGEVSEDELQNRLESSTDSTGALLIPTNIDAELTVTANNILYSDMLLNKLQGAVLVYDGGVKLDSLSARTDMGSLDLTALYSARTKRDISFGFSLGVHDFNIERFTSLMPMVDSLLPLMRDFRGIINADVAATSAIDSLMNIELPTLHAAIKLTGDSLVVLDRETFRTLSKWLMFKNKQRNMIDHMEVELTVNDSQLELYPFMFDIDRYRLGVMGGNDLALNLNYHISVLKSPLPFKFGVNIKGTADDMKIRVGKARFKENMAAGRTEIVETTRVNLINEIEKVFRRGVNAARLGPLGIRRPATFADEPETDTLSRADSIALAKEGIIEMPADTVPASLPAETKKHKK